MGNQQFLKIHKHLMKSKKGGGSNFKKISKGQSHTQMGIWVLAKKKNKCGRFH